MAFTQITQEDLTNKGVIGLPDTPNLSTTEMQEKFDEIALDVIVPKHNELIGELEDPAAAASIGAVDANGDPSTVQDELFGIKQAGYTKDEADAKFLAQIDAAATYLSMDDAANNYVQQEAGKGLSTNDYTDAEKNKLAGIEDNANNYVLPKGTQSEIGGVMGDGTTFTIDSNGVGHAVGGGGGGTSDYNALINKPQMNGTEIIGNKESEDYGILRPRVVITSDPGSTVTLVKGTETVTATQVSGSTTEWEANLSDYGTWTIHSVLSVAGDATQTITIDAVKLYTATVEHESATITVTFPAGATCVISKDSVTQTATTSPHTFTVYQLGTWTITTTLNGVSKTTTATVSSDGDSQSVTVAFASIEVTYDASFIGSTITCTDSVTTYTMTAPSSGDPITFTIPTAGTWIISGTIGGDTYDTTTVVTTLTSYQATLHVFQATVTVTFPYNKGATCTLSDGITTLAATTSPMAFNVGNTGTWTATVTLDGASKTGSTYISTDGESKSITVEYGTINLTYEAAFQGTTISCVNGGTTISKTAPASGTTMVFYPPTTGTWTISGVVSGTTYDTTATVSALGTAVSATLITTPDGATVTPTNVIQTWLKCANLTKSYTTIQQVLADSTTLLALISNNNAVDYMVRSTSWASSVCGDSTAMTDIGANNYCANTLLANSTWCSAICNSTYFESVLNAKVPTMTSNTTPSGLCFADSSYGTGFEPWRAFKQPRDADMTNATWWSNEGTTSSERWLGYMFTSNVMVKKMVYEPNTQFYSRITSIKLQGSTDGTNYVDLSSTVTVGSDASPTTVLANNNNQYKYYRIYMVPNNRSISVLGLQFYGRKDV